MSILSDLDNMVLFDTNHPPLGNKEGSPLTPAEWDARVTAMYDAIQSIVSGVNVTAYNPATTYDAASTDIYKRFAGYNSRIWQAIGTFTGETPEEGVYWTQVTLAELIPDVLALISNANAGTLDNAYDFGGAGAGREIDAVDGAVKISGEDGFVVTGSGMTGAAIAETGAGSRMLFNPRKGAFRAGFVTGTQWDDVNVGEGSTAMGINTTASGETSTAMGFETTASGVDSTAIGSGTTSESYAETAIGSFNTDYTPTSPTSWNATDRLLVVGNGQTSGTRADALIIQKNGNLTMPTTTGAFSPPILTTTQRNALTPTAGMMIYNSTDNKHQGYDGTSWNNFY